MPIAISRFPPGSLVSFLASPFQAPPPEGLDSDQKHDRKRGKRERDDVALLCLVLIERAEDVERGRLRASLHLSADDEHSTDLPDRARRGERHSIEETPADVGEGDAEKRLQPRGAERPGRLLLLHAEFLQERHYLADDEGDRDEDR